MQRSVPSTRILVTLLLATAVSPSLRAQSGAPDVIPFQGYLTDEVGDPLADGTYALTFKLYTASSGGSPTWTEAHTGGNEIQVTNGVFDVLLGTIQSLSGITFEQQLYLGITVESDSEISPRTRLGSVPYALAMRDIYSSGNETVVSTNLGIGGAPTRELTVGDVDNSGGTIMNLVATDRELLIGVNPSTGALVRGTTDNNLNLGAGGSDHLTVRSDGDIHVHENLLVGTSDYRGKLTVRGPDNATTGPIMYMFGDNSDQDESGRIRFVEGTSSANWRGAFIHYDGSANALYIGTHDASDSNPGNDANAITIGRASGNVTVHEDLIVNDHTMRATPIAAGVVDASAEDFISATPNIVDLFYVGDRWEIFLIDGCTSDNQVEQEVVASITMRETGVDEILTIPSCNNSTDCPNSPSSCVVVEVETNNTFGAQKKDFQFVVHRF